MIQQKGSPFKLNFEPDAGRIFPGRIPEGKERRIRLRAADDVLLDKQPSGF